MTEPGGGAIGLAIRRPVGVMVAVILVVLFGLLSLRGLPIQLTPDIEVPTLTVTTAWPGAAPTEVEAEIIEEQEAVLKSVQGLTRMTAEAGDSAATVTMEFEVGTDLDEAVVRVSNRLSQVPSYPENVREPVVSTADAAGPPLVVILLQARDGGPVGAYRTWVADNVVPRLERIEGVAGVRHFGGRDQQVEIRFDPAALAARGVTIEGLVAAVRAELRDLSGGDLDMGKRRYLVRTPVAPEVPEQLEAVVIAMGPDGEAVRLGDVAEARIGLRKRSAYVMGNGHESMALLFSREAGSNVLEVTDAIYAEVASIQQRELDPLGLELKIVADQRGYINGALDLVTQNLLLGAALASVVLVLFLRSFAAAAVVAVAIPVCVMGTAWGMSSLGRTVNVVSLAGMAFAVGMVVDNAIVVLENIDTWRKRTPDIRVAALGATREVWGAILASTATTAAVFVPVLGWQDEVGELLRDVAAAISVSVMLSLLVSVLVIPSFAAKVLEGGIPVPTGRSAAIGARFRDRVGALVESLVGSPLRSGGVVLAALAGAALLVTALLPPMEYLPTGNRNLLFGVLVPPPGYSVAEMTRIGTFVEGQMWRHNQANPEHVANDAADGVPTIARTFFVARPGLGFMGGSTVDDAAIGDLVGFVRGVQGQIPGVFGVASQASLFGRNIGSGRSVDVEISGADLETLIGLGGRMMGMIRELMPDAQVRPVPSLDLGSPELQASPRREQLAAQGMTAASLGLAVDALVDGRIIGELGREGEAQLDVVVVARWGQEPAAGDAGAELMAGAVASPAALAAAPAATPRGGVVPLGTLAELVEDVGPAVIQRIERRRAITLQVSPGEGQALESAMDMLSEQVVAPLAAEGAIPDGVRIDLAGAADKLAEARGRLGEVLLLAVVITFLLLAALFEDFLSPLVILVSVPLAAAGGVVGLRLVDALLGGQGFDMMTAMGFIILIGVVVNNAILVVDGALGRLREGDGLRSALGEAVRARVRPIFMSTLTSLAGLLPLVLFPGSGSELYRGVGAIVLGGLALSTVLTLFVVPALFSLVWRLRGAVL